MGKLVNVIFRESHPKYAYFAGQRGKIDADKAKELLQSGHVIIAPDLDDNTDPIPVLIASQFAKPVPVRVPVENPLPSDFPARIILFGAGFDTVDKVLQAGEAITDIKGIGKGTIKQIDNWVKKH